MLEATMGKSVQPLVKIRKTCHPNVRIRIGRLFFDAMKNTAPQSSTRKRTRLRSMYMKVLRNKQDLRLMPVTCDLRQNIMVRPNTDPTSWQFF
jgi:hypothetical protein